VNEIIPLPLVVPFADQRDQAGREAEGYGGLQLSNAGGCFKLYRFTVDPELNLSFRTPYRIIR